MGVIDEGHAAQRLLENSLLKQVIEEMKQECHAGWSRMLVDDVEGMKRAKMLLEAVKIFETTLGAKVTAMEKQLYEEKLKGE